VQCDANPNEWRPSCCIHPSIQWHDSPLRPGAHGQVLENYQQQGMEIEEREVDEER